MKKFHSCWYILTAVAFFWDGSLAIGQDWNTSSRRNAIQKPSSQPLSLDTLDSLGKSAKETATGKTSTDFSLSQLDQASSESDSSELVDFTPQSWTDNLRSTVDLSYRPIYSGRTGSFGGFAFAGIDLHKVFTDRKGDWGTLTFQAYWTRMDNQPPMPSIFDDDSDFELVYRILNFNYTGRGKGKTNFRIGHYEIPFGLEQIVNTNGTIRDFTHDENFGFKSDWGVTFNGQASGVEYELGLSRGSGNEWRRRDDPFIVAGRIGTSRDQPVILGISAFYGDVLSFEPAGGTIERARVGTDFTFADEKLIWMGELSAGFEDNDRAYTALLEVDWTDAKETWLAYNQIVLRGFGRVTGWDNEFRNSIGVRWTPDQHWTFSSQISHFFDALETETLAIDSRGTVLEFQTRYRF